MLAPQKRTAASLLHRKVVLFCERIEIRHSKQREFVELTPSCMCMFRWTEAHRLLFSCSCFMYCSAFWPCVSFSCLRAASLESIKSSFRCVSLDSARERCNSKFACQSLGQVNVFLVSSWLTCSSLVRSRIHISLCLRIVDNSCWHASRHFWSCPQRKNCTNRVSVRCRHQEELKVTL